MKVKHKGYEAVQDRRNHHIMIFKNGRMCLHATWDKQLSKEELKKEIERYIELRGMRL